MSEYISETQTYDDYDRYGGGRRNYNDETFTETETFSERGPGGHPPPPPGLPWPWAAHWDNRAGRYVFVHQQTGERVWSVQEVEMRVYGGGGGGGREQVYEQRDESEVYDRGVGPRPGYYGPGPRGYGGGGDERVYESRTVVEDESMRRRGGGGGGRGLEYGAMGAVAGVAAGAYAMYEGEKIHNDYEDDKYRVEGDVDRFDDRVEDGFDNAVDDVEDAPEEVAGWVGDKVGEVDRFDENVDVSYDQGVDDGYDGGDF